MRSAPMHRHEVGIAAKLIPGSRINRLRFESSQDLLDRGAIVVDETGRTELSGARMMLAVQGTRATHSFESVLALCRIGRGAQAAMVNRSLLEDALDVHWVAANPDRAPAMADEHETLIRLGERAMLARFGDNREELSTAEADELARLNKIYDGFHRSWTLASDRERIALINERWGNDREANVLIEKTYTFIQRQNNVLHHSSPTGLSVAMMPGRGGPNRAGPDGWWVTALGHSALAYYFTLRVIMEEFGFDKEATADAFVRASRFIRELRPEEITGVTAVDPCPCQSGLTYAHCHGG